jgi:hypothetical protein
MFPIPHETGTIAVPLGLDPELEWAFADPGPVLCTAWKTYAAQEKLR